MGVVYKAEDTKLKRAVALKFLPAHLLGDSEIKARFEREAQAAAALDHPNICTVHEIDEADGKTFLAMAFLKGRTLEEHIAEGPMALDKALDIARQVAEGLGAAHTENIVHRDIKPANILISPDGRATIMDFGLARLTEASRLTKGEATMGTVAYMSPEQAEGGDVDNRSDLWALGVVLYEMVAGQRPFTGQYDQALFYEIVNQEHEPLTGIRAGLPMELEFIVGKCMAKSADDRYQHASEIVVDLRTLGEKLKSGKSRVVSAGGGLSKSIERTRVDAPSLPESGRGGAKRDRLVWCVAAMFAVAFIALAVAYFGESAPELETTRFLVQPPEGVRFGPRAAEISPDGRHLAFTGDSSTRGRLLWVRSIDSIEPRSLAGTEGAENPFWSPDSRFLGFFADGKLKKIDIAGRPAQTLCDAPNNRGGAWSQGSQGDDGVIVFGSGRGSLMRISEAGGEPTGATALNDARGEVSHRYPTFLPDRRHFLYTSRGGGKFEVNFGALDRSNGETTEPREPVLVSDTPVRYAPPTPAHPNGYLIFASENSLMAQQFDTASLKLAGRPFPLAERVAATTGGLTPSDFSVSRNGTLVYRSRDAVGLFQLMWFDRGGEPLGSVGEYGRHSAVSLSPDDSRVALSSGGVDELGNFDVWVHDLARGVASRLTFDPALELSQIWSPDGKRMVFSSSRGGGAFDLYVKPTSGAGDAELLLATDHVKGPRSWSRDGRSILYVELRPTTDWDLWVLPLEGERKPVPYLRTEFNEVLGQFSPDGRWIAYVSDESRRDEVYVQPYPVDGGKWQVSTDGGSQPRWRDDGKELYYLAPGDTIMAVDIDATETFRPGVPSALFSVEGMNSSTTASAYFHYDVSNDGRRFLIDVVSEEGEQALVTVVQNWQAELER